MYIKKYSILLRDIIINENNIYNNFKIKNIDNLLIINQLNTYKDEKSIKIVKLFYLIFFLTKQRPFFKKVKFAYVKKQIMKSFFFYLNLHGRYFNNLLLYFNNFYLYFFNLYYSLNLKYNFNSKNFVFYIENIHNQYKKYGRLNIKSSLKIIFVNNENNLNIFFKLISAYNFIKIYNALPINKK
jgi:hypothetical protein